MEKIDYDYFIIGFVFGTLIIGIIYIIANRNIPTAMDVYRGKTTIEITYRDSIPIDSVVVYK